MRLHGAAPMREIELSLASEADVAFVMAAERQEGFDEFVGRWERERHLTALQSNNYRYFVGRIAGAPIGFVIVRDWASPQRVTYIKRIAVTDPSKGLGRALLAKVIDRIFAETEAFRVWLGVFTENERAQRAYRAIGFKDEGISRGSAFFYGRHRDELVMAVLRPEWRSAAA
jgi:diamine N-acetyltransferase